MRFHNRNSHVLKKANVYTSTPESYEVIYPTTKTSPKRKKKMSAFIDTFYNSFSSTGPQSGQQQQHQPQQQQQPKHHTVYSEMQLLKVTAPKHDLEKFSKEISRIKENVGIRVDIKVIRPSRKHEERVKKIEEREKQNHDLLDYMFSDTIPFFHDFLVYGSPEIKFFQIKGKKGDLDIFNKLCQQMVFGKELQCKLEVTDRRQIPVQDKLKSSIFGGPNSEPDIFDAMFTDNLSSCNPFLHNMLLSVC